MTDRRFTRTMYSLGYLLRHPYRSLVAVWREREADQIHSSSTSNAMLPQIEMNAILEDRPIHLKICSFLTGGSTAPDYALLRGACEFCARKHGEDYRVDYLEIGTWRGESIINVMESDKVNSAYSVTLGMDLEDNAAIKNNANFFLARYHSEKFHQVFANSMKFDFSTLNKKFDVIFIDGDHSYEAILNDTKKAETLLKDEHSIIVWHDYMYNPETLRPVTLNAIKAGLSREKQEHLYHVKNTLCAIYLQGQFHSIEQSEGIATPTSSFEVDIKQHML